MLNIDKELTVFNKIIYHDEPHHYFLGDKHLISTTGILGRFSDEFDTEGQAAKYVTSKNNINKWNYNQILENWNYKRDHACFEGKVLHSFAENYIARKVFPYPKDNGINIPFNDIESTYKIMEKYFINFYNDYIATGILIPVKSEVIMFDPILEIAGMSDQIFFDNRYECYVIYDWKTNTELNTGSDPYNHKMLHCLNHLDCTELNKYSLQLGIYQYIIERNTNIRFPHKNMIVWFNENNNNYELIECHNFKQEIINMFNLKTTNPDLFSLDYIAPKRVEKEYKYEESKVNKHNYFSI